MLNVAWIQKWYHFKAEDILSKYVKYPKLTMDSLWVVCGASQMFMKIKLYKIFQEYSSFQYNLLKEQFDVCIIFTVDILNCFCFPYAEMTTVCRFHFLVSDATIQMLFRFPIVKQYSRQDIWCISLVCWEFIQAFNIIRLLVHMYLVFYGMSCPNMALKVVKCSDVKVRKQGTLQFIHWVIPSRIPLKYWCLFFV